jgi:S1-C subfamily serine protease
MPNKRKQFPKNFKRDLERDNELNAVSSHSNVDDEEHQQLTDSLKGVVQVFVHGVEPSFNQPWTKSVPTGGTGSGFVIDVMLRLIITNAHVAEFARTILLRKNGDHAKYEAQLLAISHQVDIAILTVEDDSVWEGAEILPFGNLC